MCNDNFITGPYWNAECNFEIMEVVVTNTGQCGTTSALIVNVSKSNTKGLGLLCDDSCTNE